MSVTPRVNAGGDQRVNKPDPFWNDQNDVLKSYSFNYEALTTFKQKVAWVDSSCGFFCCP